MKLNTLSIFAVLLGLTLSANAQLICDFEDDSDGVGGQYVFQEPSFSDSTSGNIEAGTSFAWQSDDFPEGDGIDGIGYYVYLGYYVYQMRYNLTAPAGWVRLSTFNTVRLPNPTVDLTQGLSLDIHSDRQVYVTLGLRETGTEADIGADGGTSGGIEWVGGSSDETSSPPLGQLVPAGVWTRLTFWFPDGPVKPFAGDTADGVLTSATGKGVLEHLALIAPNLSGAELGVYNIRLDNLMVIPEPSSLALAVLGLATLGFMRRRRQ